MSKEFVPQIQILKPIINLIKDHFVKRGYEKTMVEKEIRNIQKLLRSALLVE